jgi:hypothetical protein
MKLFLNENYKVENYSVPSTKEPIDEIDDIANSISDNISKEIKIPSDVLNSFAIKSELNPKIWIGDKLNPKVRTKLIKIATDFFNELELPSEVKMKDIIFTGSLANFNWSKFSDIDLHIVLDFSQIEAEDKFKEDFFYAQKALWNQAHDITVFDYPVELYAQDIKAKLVASAVYSVKFDKWILKASREDFKVNKKVIKQKADRFIDNLKDIRKDYQENKLQSVVDKVKSLKDKIKNYRTSGLEKGGEYAIENLVFKTLRRTPFMDILDSYKSKAYDKLMSVKETIKESLRTLTEAKNYSTKEDLYRTRFKIAKAFELYGNDPYFRNADEGEWVGEVLVYPNGELFARRMKHSAYDIKQNDLGGRGESGSYKNLGIFRAYQGADQPNQVRTSYAKTISMGKNAEEEIQFSEELPQGVSLENGATTITFGLPKPGSPASDAAIKAYILQADDIIDYVTIKDPNYNAYTAHDDAADIAKEKTADKNQYKFGKLDKEKEMAANVQKDRTLVDPSKETGAERKARMDAEREKKRQELRAKRGL